MSVALAMAAVVGAGSAAATEPDEGGVARTVLHTRGDTEPWVASSVTGECRHQLMVAYKIALQEVRQSTSCAALFEDLGADAEATLKSTLYTMSAQCKGGVAAYTAVGHQVTWLCPCFSRLSREEAAVIVVHEALHFAGMTEYPGDPDGPTSFEINRMVRRACRF